MASSTATDPPASSPSALHYIRYNPAQEDTHVAAMRQLISKDLSEPYSIYVYRYFLYQWADLCFLAMDTDAAGNEQMVGVVVSKLEPHRHGPLRGYIAMLAVSQEYRGQGIATKLVRMAIDAMEKGGADEVRYLRKIFTCSCLMNNTNIACNFVPDRSPSKPKSQIPRRLSFMNGSGSCGVSACIGTT